MTCDTSQMSNACLPPPGAIDGSIHVLRNNLGAEIRWLWLGRRWLYAARPSTRKTPRAMAKLGWSHKEAVTNA